MKPDNILIEKLKDESESKNYRIKITDFGSAREIKEGKQEEKIAFTKCYASEFYNDIVHINSDLFSIGMMIPELITNELRKWNEGYKIPIISKGIVKKLLGTELQKLYENLCKNRS